jgi:hypothetical protein
MAKSQNKTQPHGGSVAAFINSVADEGQRADAETLCTLMAQLSGEEPTLWGPSIIGFGDYLYKYKSGREGRSLRIGFSPRKNQTVIYLVNGYGKYDALRARLGKQKIGKSCLYIKRLSDVDMAVLETMITASLAYMDDKYPKPD